MVKSNLVVTVVSALLLAVPAARPAPPPEDDAIPDREKTCEQLYAEITRLTAPPGYPHPYLWSHPYSAPITAAGLVAPPSILLWSYPAYARQRQQREIAAATQRILELRRIAADKRCFLH